MPKVCKSISILKAAAEGNEKELKKIIKNSRKIKLRDNHNWNALHHAVSSKNPACVKLLLAQTKLNPQDECYEGRTPLFLACSYFDTPIEIVEEFLKRDKTLVEFMNNEMQSPLHMAVSNNRLDIVKALIENGADVDYMDLDNDTPLHIAASNLHYDIIEYMLYNGQCNTAIKNDFNMNPFELIVHLYETDHPQIQQHDKSLVLKCLDMLSDFTYDEILGPNNELFDLTLKDWNEPLTYFIINKYYRNSSSTNDSSRYFTNLLVKYNICVYAAFVLVHDSVKSINDLNLIPSENQYTSLFNFLFLNFREEYYEIIYEILSKGDNCFDATWNSTEFYRNLIYIDSVPHIISLLFQFNHNLNLLRYNVVNSFYNNVRISKKINLLRIVNSFTTFDERYIDVQEKILWNCYNELNNVDAFMHLFLPVYELQWKRLNKIMNINYVPSLKQMAIFKIRKILFDNYAKYSNSLKMRMIGELPLPTQVQNMLIFYEL